MYNIWHMKILMKNGIIKYTAFAIAFAILLSGLVAVVDAKGGKSKGEALFVTNSGNKYVFSENLFSTTSPTTGDIIGAVGGSVHINERVSGDIIVASRGVDISAPVRGDLRIVSTSVLINSTVSGDTEFLTTDLHVGASGNISGDLSRSTIENVRIEGTVNGDLILSEKIKTLNIGPDARILGNISHSIEKENRLNVSDGAVISGEINFVEAKSYKQYAEQKSLFASILYHFIYVFILSMLVYLVARRHTGCFTKHNFKQSFLYFLLGIGVVFAGLILSVLLLASFFFALFGGVLLLTILALVVISIILSPIVFGFLLFQKEKGDTFKSYGKVLAISALILALLGALEIGYIIYFILTMFITGVLASKIYRGLFN